MSCELMFSCLSNCGLLFVLQNSFFYFWRTKQIPGGGEAIYGIKLVKSKVEIPAICETNVLKACDKEQKNKDFMSQIMSDILATNLELKSLSNRFPWKQTNLEGLKFHFFSFTSPPQVMWSTSNVLLSPWTC